jgi:hypothetical protein
VVIDAEPVDQMQADRPNGRRHGGQVRGEPFHERILCRGNRSADAVLSRSQSSRRTSRSMGVSCALSSAHGGSPCRKSRGARG